MDKEKKRAFVKDLHVSFNQVECVVVAHYAGISVAQMDGLRSKMRQSGGFIKVAKNSLAKIAVKDTPLELIIHLFKGQTLIAGSQDPVSAAKVVYDFLKENKHLVVLGGVMGSKALSVESLKFLASLPSLDELRSGILSIISAPASRVVRVINSPAGCVARCLNARSMQECKE